MQHPVDRSLFVQETVITPKHPPLPRSRPVNQSIFHCWSAPSEWASDWYQRGLSTKTYSTIGLFRNPFIMLKGYQPKGHLLHVQEPQAEQIRMRNQQFPPGNSRPVERRPMDPILPDEMALKPSKIIAKQWAQIFPLSANSESSWTSYLHVSQLSQTAVFGSPVFHPFLPD